MKRNVIVCAGLHQNWSPIGRHEYNRLGYGICQNSREWNGDVAGYTANMKLWDGYQAIPASECTYTIHNVPDGAYVIVDANGIPHEMLWAMGDIAEWYFPNDEHIDDICGTGAPCCISHSSLAEMADYCWGMDVEEIMEWVHEATDDEISSYGTEQ